MEMKTSTDFHRSEIRTTIKFDHYNRVFLNHTPKYTRQVYANKIKLI